MRALATFRRINLVQSYSWGREFPVIFCRNVMIYFDKPTQEQVIRLLTACLEPGGYLFVGHAESLNRVSHSLDYIQPAIYRKPLHHASPQACTGPEKEASWNRSS
jgi:chemotaxis protein methyltransferase CheR